MAVSLDSIESSLSRLPPPVKAIPNIPIVEIVKIGCNIISLEP
jgi:hypothetical protein